MASRSLGQSESRNLGLQKLKSAYSSRQSEAQLQILNNRIQKLIQQEKAARTSILNTEKKAEIIEKTRQRHVQDLQRKKLMKEIREKLRKKAGQTIREFRQSHKRMMEHNLNHMKYYANSARQIRRKEKLENSEFIQKEREDNLQKKIYAYRDMVNQRNQSLNLREENSVDYRRNIRNMYLDSIEEFKKKSSNVQQKIRMASQSETDLIEKLSNTMSLQNNARSRLEQAQKISKEPIEFSKKNIL